MKRREFLAVPAILIGGAAMADTPKVQSLDDALRWLDRLEKAPIVRSTTDWPMVAVMQHMAQSVEMSMDGFPQPNPAWFQHSAGTAAFAYFKWRGQMSHSLTEPIPGAPALSTFGDWKPAGQRLRAAIARFQAFNGVLQPHFAYGALGKADYALAHTLHIANHQDEIVVE